MHESNITKSSRWPMEIHEPGQELSSLFIRIIPWQRWEWWVVAGLFAITLCTRWPLRVMSLEELDSANYALGLREFNISRHQPHPPGYLFFIGAARFANLWTQDPIGALTAVQVVSGAVTSMLFYGLLRLSMPPTWALGTTVLLTFSGQVWFQHVRPMEDAYAFLWMLAAIYGFVRSLGGDARWWVGGMIILGLGMGAKQLLPGFLVGLLIRTLWDCIHHGRFRMIALGLLGSMIASLAWFVPLSLHVGAAQDYVAAALRQLAWGREHEALLFNWTPSRMSEQLRTTLVLPWGPRSVAPLMWCLVTLGASQVLLYYPSLRWLLWLVVPILLVRFFFLGYWPRFSIYYLPFLLPLMVVGAHTLVGASVRAIRRIGLFFAQNASLVILHRPSLVFTILGMLLLPTWVAIQTIYISPTLRVLHDDPTPVVEAMQLIRQHYNPTATVILIDNDLIDRHLDYYAAGTGFFKVYEQHLNAGHFDIIQRARHVLRIQAGLIPPSASGYLGTWALRVPRWRDLSLHDDFLRVGLYELQGPFMLFSGWHGPEDAARTLRWSRPEGSQIQVFRVPPHGSAIRLQGMVHRQAAQPSGPLVMIRINGKPAYAGKDGRVDLSLHVEPKEITGHWATIDVQPNCRFVPAEIDRFSQDRRRLGCFRLTDLTIQP